MVIDLKGEELGRYWSYPSERYWGLGPPGWSSGDGWKCWILDLFGGEGRANTVCSRIRCKVWGQDKNNNFFFPQTSGRMGMEQIWKEDPGVELGICWCQMEISKRLLGCTFQGRLVSGTNQLIGHSYSHKIVHLKPFSNSAWALIYINSNPNQRLLLAECREYECSKTVLSPVRRVHKYKSQHSMTGDGGM